MGAIFDGPPKPPSVPMPPPAAHPSTMGASQAQLAGQGASQRGAAAAGMGSNDTVKTSPQGLPTASTAKNTLLGG